MKVKSIKEEFKTMNNDALVSKIEEMRRELLTLRLQAATSAVKSFASTKRGLKSAIACGLNLLNERQLEVK